MKATTIRKFTASTVTVMTLMGSSITIAQDGADANIADELSIMDNSEIASVERRPRRLGDSMAANSNNEWVPGLRTQDDGAALDRKINLGRRALEAGNLLDPANGSALEFFQQALEIDDSSQDAINGIKAIASQLIGLAREADAGGDRSAALRHLDRVRGFSPGHPDIDKIQEEFARQDQLNSLFADATAFVETNKLVGDGNDNATAAYRAILDIDAENTAALEALVQVEDRLIGEAESAQIQGEFELARSQLELARAVRGGSDAINSSALAIDEAEQAMWQERRRDVVQLIQAENLDLAERSLASLVDSGYQGPLKDLEEQIVDQRRLLAYVPKTPLTDTLGSEPGPELIVIGRGEFTMGSPPYEQGHLSREGPQQTVSFRRPFAISKTEVTVEEFRRFVEATGYVTDVEKSGVSSVFDVKAGVMKKQKGVSWRKDYSGDRAKRELPVLHVSYNDAVAYTAWLSGSTGHIYRLPSESEFEYVLRGGSHSRYWWGDGAPGKKVENLTGERDTVRGYEWPNPFEGYGDGHWGPAEVASFKPNPFGVFDIGGNVMEWVQDCSGKDLSEIPDNGAPRLNGDCAARVIRGASWANPPEMARSAFRSSAAADSGSCLVGFRVVRQL